MAHLSLPLTCPPYKGDSVLVHWENLDKRMLSKQVYQYDRWRDSTAPPAEGGPQIQLAGPPYNAYSGFFSFLLSPELRDAGVFTCDVFRDDKCYRRRTTLSVLKGTSYRGKRGSGRITPYILHVSNLRFLHCYYSR